MVEISKSDFKTVISAQVLRKGLCNKDGGAEKPTVFILSQPIINFCLLRWRIREISNTLDRHVNI